MAGLVSLNFPCFASRRNIHSIVVSAGKLGSGPGALPSDRCQPSLLILSCAHLDTSPRTETVATAAGVARLPLAEYTLAPRNRSQL